MTFEKGEREVEIPVERQEFQARRAAQCAKFSSRSCFLVPMSFCFCSSHIGNIPAGCSEEEVEAEIRLHCADVELLEDVEFHLVLDTDGNSRGFGFANFTSEEARSCFITIIQGAPLCGSSGFVASEAKYKKRIKAGKSEAEETQPAPYRQWLSRGATGKSKPKHAYTLSTNVERRKSKCN